MKKHDEINKKQSDLEKILNEKIKEIENFKNISKKDQKTISTALSVNTNPTIHKRFSSQPIFTENVANSTGGGTWGRLFVDLKTPKMMFSRVDNR